MDDSERSIRILELERLCFGASAWTPEQISSFFAHSGQCILAADYYCLFRNTGDCIELERIAVAAPARNKGYARRMIKEISGCNKPVWIEVEASNEAALNLYRKTGFQFSRIRKDYYGPGKNAVVMVKDHAGTI